MPQNNRVEPVESHDHWVKRTLCEDTAEVERKEGHLPHSQDIANMWQKDLEHWDGEQRDGAGTQLTTPDGDNLKRADATNEALLEQYEKSGQAVPDKFERRDEFTDKPGVRPLPGTTEDKLHQRMLMLMQTVPIAERVLKAAVWQNCIYPEYAREILGLFVRLNLAKKDRRGKTEKEIGNFFQRKMEDIADRSASVIGLGAWR